MGRLDGKVCVITGAGGGMGADAAVLFSEEGAQELLELVPQARLVDVAGAGHMVAGDRNDLFNDAVASFLDDVRD